VESAKGAAAAAEKVGVEHGATVRFGGVRSDGNGEKRTPAEIIVAAKLANSKGGGANYFKDHTEVNRVYRREYVAKLDAIRMRKEEEMRKKKKKTPMTDIFYCSDCKYYDWNADVIARHFKTCRGLDMNRKVLKYMQ